MATSADQIILGLLQGSGLGRTQGDNVQQSQQIEAGQLQLDAARQQQAQAQQYQQDVQGYFADPKPQRLAMLMMKYPQQAEAVKASKAALDEPQRQSQLTQYSQFYNAANANRPDLLLKQAQAIKTAEAAQGVDTSEIDDFIGQIQSDDPAAKAAAVKNAVALSQVHLAALDPKFAESIQKAGKPGDTKGTVVGRAIGHYDGDKWVVDYRDPEAAKVEYRTVKNGDGSESVIAVGGGGPASSGGAPSYGGGAPGSLDPKKFYHDFVLPHEGGYAAHDANGAPVNHGINQSANPGVDVKNLTPDQAAQIFTDKYYAQSGAANLPPALAAIHADTSFINPKRAAQFLQASGGDPAKYMTMRQSWMNSLVQNQPDKYGKYEKAWNNRNRDLSAYAQQVGGGSGTAGAPNGPQVVYTSKPAAGDSGLTGQAYLNTLPTGRAALIKAVIDGRAPAPRPGSKYGEQLAEDIAQTDPSIDTTTLPMRQQARKDFTGGGKQAIVMSSLNRFAAHLNSAWENHLELGGPNLGPLSGIAASVSQSFDPKHVKGYNTELEAIQGEFQKLTKNGVSSETEADRLISNAKAAQSSEGRAAALQAMAKLALAQYPNMINQWHSAFPERPLPVDLQPGAMASLQNIIKGGDKALPVDHNGAPYLAARPQTSSGFKILRVRPK